MANLLDILSIKNCTRSLAKQLQSHLVVSGSLKLQRCLTRSRLLEVYSFALNDLPTAIDIFRQIPFPSTNDCNAILRGFTISDAPECAFLCYRAMNRALRKVDALTCSFVLKSLIRVLRTVEFLQLHSHVVRKGFLADAKLATTLLQAYSKAGNVNNARNVFDEMPHRDIAAWNALISGLAASGKPKEAIDMFDRMGREGFKPNAMSFLGALSACAHLGAFKEGERLHKHIRNEELGTNVHVCNALIDMYAKCGYVEYACKVFDEMSCERTTITWSSMMMAFAIDGDGARALALFNKMETEKAQPDSVTFLGLLSACNHGGLVGEGTRVFHSMENMFNVKPNIKHYGTLVDLLGRAGRLKDAYRTVLKIPLNSDAVLWQTLLGACRTHGDVPMAEAVTSKLAQMGAKNCGDFVLLSHVYAARSRWTDVGLVRETMKLNDVRKIPGVSYIEHGNAVHMFYNGDTSHVRWKEISGKLTEIMARIKGFGYVPETGFVLHDVGDEEKEQALSQHSEKLAVAFGMLSVEECCPINVFKNLRICGDCHAMFKVVSNVYKREIIVRDGVRFHRFKHGLCSCKDYW